MMSTDPHYVPSASETAAGSFEHIGRYDVAVAELATSVPFSLPRGYRDSNGSTYQNGIMRLATARDELLPVLDERVRSHPEYLTVVLLSRVVTRLGDLEGEAVTPEVIENLYASDFAFLEDLYRRLNSEGSAQTSVVCPACRARIIVNLADGSASRASPGAEPTADPRPDPGS